MPDTPARPPRFWETVSEHVTATVEQARNQTGDERASVIVYLRGLEDVARRECQPRDTIQVIASGRRLLGDHDEALPMDTSGAPSHSFSGTQTVHHELNLHE